MLDLSQANALPPELTLFLADERNAVTEDGFLPSRMPASLDFARAVVANWKDVLINSRTVAPDLRRQALIIVAAEFLPPKDYVAFVNSVGAPNSPSHVSDEAVRFVLWARMAKAGFLAFNYDHPDVAGVIATLERRLMASAPNDWRDFFLDLKSGTMKQRLVDRRVREGDKLPESISVRVSEPYRRLMGGSVKEDIKLVATRPIEAVASLSSVNRERWSMVVAIALIAAFACLVGLLVRAWRKRLRRKAGTEISGK
jgi:hypothetical protein